MFKFRIFNIWLYLDITKEKLNNNSFSLKSECHKK